MTTGGDTRQRAGGSQERAAGSAGRDMFSSRPRVSTVSRAHGLAFCSPNRSLRATASSQGIQRAGELTRAVLTGQGIGIERHHGLDPRCPQLARRSAGAPDPAAHRAVRNVEVTRDEPVPAAPGGSDQGQADQAGRAGAAGQQSAAVAYLPLTEAVTAAGHPTSL